jgi:hypothetical protein
VNSVAATALPADRTRIAASIDFIIVAPCWYRAGSVPA